MPAYREKLLSSSLAAALEAVEAPRSSRERCAKAPGRTRAMRCMLLLVVEGSEPQEVPDQHPSTSCL